MAGCLLMFFVRLGLSNLIAHKLRYQMQNIR